MNIEPRRDVPVKQFNPEKPLDIGCRTWFNTFMSFPAIIIGSAFQSEPLDGNVRNYTAADGSTWIGHDTHDVLYFCDEDERAFWMAQYGPNTDTGSDNQVDLDGSTYDLEASTPSPDYSTYCTSCEALLSYVEEV